MFKGILSFFVSLAIMTAYTAFLWHLKFAAGTPRHLVYLYLLPVVLIAILFTGRLAVLSAAISMACAAYFLQDPVFSFRSNNPLEYGDLIWFAVLSALSIKCIRKLMRQATSLPAKTLGISYFGTSKLIDCDVGTDRSERV